MGSHIVNGQFQSDKYPTTPPGKVPLSVKDPTTQDLLWEYAQRRRSVDAEFSDDLQQCLANAGFDSASSRRTYEDEVTIAELQAMVRIANAARDVLQKFGDEYPGRLDPLREAVNALDVLKVGTK